MRADTGRRRKDSGTLLTNLLLLTVAIAIALLLAEGVFRLFGLASPILYRPDPTFGYEPRPNQTATRLGTTVYINDISLRDDESYAALMKGRERLLVIGNSVSFGGTAVPQPDLFSEVVERTLSAERPGIKVLNGGVDGFSVTQMMKRAPRLVRLTEPDYLILYVVRDDFYRPPVRFPTEANFRLPIKQPRSALGVVALLSIDHLDGRYFNHLIDHFPPGLKKLWKGPLSYVPPYDTSTIVDTHFAAIDEFLRTVWEASGRDRRHIVVFISPTRQDVLANHVMPNADLVAKFEARGIKAYDLQRDFHDAIIGKGEDVSRYYWDKVHYTAKGNHLAARAIYNHLASQVLSGR